MIDEAKLSAPAPQPPVPPAAPPAGTPKPLIVLGDQDAATCTDGRCE